jgi:hypothetical protein
MSLPYATGEELREAQRRVERDWEERIERRSANQKSEDDTVRICAELAGERERQNDKWGGPDHDLQHGPRDWGAFITEHLGKALSANQPQNYRRRMLQVAALAVAAIETLDRQADSTEGRG